MASSLRTRALVVAIYAAATLLMTWPLLGHFSTALPHDLGDPAFVSWVFWWNAHATPLTDHWWNAPIFVPISGAFAFSESILGLAPLTTPLQWAGASPVFVYNVAFVLSFFLSAVCAHALAYRLTKRHDAALIAGLAYGFSPFRVSQMPHLQLLITWWIPLGLFALHRFIEQRRPRDLVLLGLCWCLNGLSSGYLLVFFGVVLALWVLWYVRTARDLALIAGTLAIATLPMAPVLIGYQHRQAAFGFSRGMQEIEGLSAQVQSFWSAPPDLWARHWTFGSLPEADLYPGLIIAALAIAGAFVAWRTLASPPRSRGRRSLLLIAALFTAIGAAEAASGGWQPTFGGHTISLTHPYKIMSVAVWLSAIAFCWDRRWLDAWRRRSSFAFYGIAAGVAAVLALGPTGKIFGARFLEFAPYTWLMSMPGGHALRVPARFGHIAILCLGQAAAIAYVRFFPRGVARPALAIALIAVFVEGWLPALPIVSSPASFDVATLDPGAPLLVLPRIWLGDDTAAMLRSTADDHPLINGYSGYSPPHDDVMRYGLEHDDTTLLPALRTIGPFLIVVDRTRDTDNRARTLVERAPGITLVRQTDQALVYRAAADSKAPAEHDPRVSIAGVRYERRRIDAAADGQLGSLWENTVPQTAGQAIEIELGRSAVVSRVELDLGRAPMEYPRTLRVASETGQTLWEGDTAGLTMLGAIADPARVPVMIDIAVPVSTSRLTLTLTTPGFDDLPWGIAEIRVFGK